jgi:hypothetical protein
LTTGKYTRFESEKTDMELYVTMSWERNIVGWEGLADKKTQAALPVTNENKVALIKQVPAFREAVEAGLKVLKESETAKAEAVQENFTAGLSGTTDLIQPLAPIA